MKFMNEITYDRRLVSGSDVVGEATGKAKRKAITVDRRVLTGQMSEESESTKCLDQEYS